MNWRLGTIGFGYADWAGTFYPRGVKPGEYLSQYATCFDSVELDTTFHATPPIQRFRRWADMTPEHFRFCIKTPRAITHDLPIDRAAVPMREFVNLTARGLGDKLGVVLIQFPPKFEADQFTALGKFLAGLPRDIRFAIELRNRTWGMPRTLDLLQQNRCCLVVAEYLSRPTLIHVTTDFLYIRCIGEHERFSELNREQIDMTENLNWWKSQVNVVADRVNTTWGFFGNDYAGYAIASCNRLKILAGLPVKEPPAIPGGLFT